MRVLDTGGFPGNTILCSNDRLAIGLLSACYAKGLRIGREEGCALRVASMDDHPFSRFTCPSLTTAAHDYDSVASNAFNTLIELAVKSGSVLWTFEPGCCPGIVGDYVEHIHGTYTGRGSNAAWVTRTSWVENDNKQLYGKKVADDWGFVNATTATNATLVMKYESYKKGEFVMTWELPQAVK